mmetsp:Transcript_111036/g.264997  ORF Transcript_111036/g.264997 Transcript_111036/m.264997 type:complete len:209 (-) Transcript_111036:1135-1761(-)
MNSELLPVEQAMRCVEHSWQSTVRDLSGGATTWLRNDGICKIHKHSQPLCTDVGGVRPWLSGHLHGHLGVAAMEDLDPGLGRLGRLGQGMLQACPDSIIPSSHNQDVQRHADAFCCQLFWPGHILAATASHHKDHLHVPWCQLIPLLEDPVRILREQERLPHGIPCQKGPLILQRQGRLLRARLRERHCQLEAGINWRLAFTEHLSHF